MAQYSNLKAYIEEKIYENGTQAITGDILQDVLKVMTDDLGEFYQMGGVASPSTDPGTPDAKVIYFATEAGTYTNFGGITLAAGEVALLIFETSWTKETLNVLSSANGGVKAANLADGAVTTEKIAGGAVETAKIANNAVTSGKVADGAIGTAKIADGAIDADKIAANAVESAKIKNGAVTEGKINDGAVTADKVAANAVTTAKIADDAVTTAKLNDGAVTEDKIATDAVTSGKVKDGAIGTAKIAAGAVTHAKIGAGAVEESNIKDGAVTSDKIANGAVGSDQLAKGAFSAQNLADGSVTTDKLADNAVTAEKIADGAVTADKFANGSVTTIKLGSGAVTTEKIGNGMVTRQKLADSSVSTSKIIDGAVTTDKVADGAITDAKLQNPVSVSQNSLTIGGDYKGELSTTYDVTLHSGQTFASLSALLSDANLNTLIPLAVRKDGMSIKFVQSSDNKYVQYRLMSNTFSTTESDWQGVDDEPTAESDNLVKSGGVYEQTSYNKEVINDFEVSITSNYYISKHLPTTLSAGKKYKLTLVTRGFEATDKWAYQEAIYLNDADNNRIYLDELFGITNNAPVENKTYTCYINADYAWRDVAYICQSGYVISSSKVFVLSVDEAVDLKDKVSEVDTKVEQNKIEQEGINEQLGSEIDRLDIDVYGGSHYYVDSTITLNNQRINDNTAKVTLSTPVRSFNFKLTVPIEWNITSYGIYAYDEENNYYSYGPLAPNQEFIFTDKGYSVSKFSISYVNPNNYYTGSFRIELYNFIEGLRQTKLGKESIVNETGQSEEDIMSQKAVTDIFDIVEDDINLFRIKVDSGKIDRDNNTYIFKATSGQCLSLQLMDNDIITNSISLYAIKEDGTDSLIKVFDSPQFDVISLKYNIKGLFIGSSNNVGTTKSGDCLLKVKVSGESKDILGTAFAQELLVKGESVATIFKKSNVNYSGRFSCYIPKGSLLSVNLTSLAGHTSSQYATVSFDYSDGTYSSRVVNFTGEDFGYPANADKDIVNIYIVCSAVSESDGFILFGVKINKCLLNLLDDYNGRLTIPDYYFENNYLQNKVASINALLQSNSINSDTFIFQTDEHWEYNAKVSPALIKYIYERTLISKLFDGGDTTHNIDDSSNNINPAMTEFETYRSKMFGGKIFHAIGNHEYLTHEYQDRTLFDDVDFNNWHDSKYFYDDTEIVYGSPEGHYYYVDNKQKKFRYIVLSSYKKKTPADAHGSGYWTIATEDFSQAQLDWLTNIALNVDNGWTIVIITHMLSSIGCTEHPDGHATDVYRNSGAAIEFAKALLQYNGNGEIACVISGHTHWDCIAQIDDNYVGLTGVEATGKSIPEICTTSDGLTEVWGNNDKENPLGKVKDTTHEQAFDIVNIDKVTKKITLIRVGAPAYNLFDEGNPLYGNLEYREVNYGNE